MKTPHKGFNLDGEIVFCFITASTSMHPKVLESAEAHRRVRWSGIPKNATRYSESSLV